jgi:hypothetical protein
MSLGNKIEWCKVRLGDDLNWWVTEVSDPLHWDVDGLGIIDPRQISYIIDQCEILREYGFDTDLIDDAFYSLKINTEAEPGQVLLMRSQESLLEEENTLFALPDVIDEEKGPFADFLDQITRYRVKLLNDLIEFERNLTVDELEDDLRERLNQDYVEGRSVHPFTEIAAILDYVPDGYELDGDETVKTGDENIDDIPDFEEEEAIEEDETMKWDEDEDEEEDETYDDADDDKADADEDDAEDQDNKR